VAGWTAIILAGQRPGADPLATHFGQDWKALIPIAGRPMVTRVTETLLATPGIDRIVVLAQDPSAILPALPSDGRITLSVSGSGISSSIRALAGSETAPWPVLVTTADHPLLTPEIVTGFLAEAPGVDIAVGMVESTVLLADHPESKRTWLKFRDGWWTGANLFALGGPPAARALDLWAEAEQDRKKAWKLFLHFGPVLALRALTRTIGLADGLARAGQQLGLHARLVPLKHSAAAIDVDKPVDHELAEAILTRRVSAVPLPPADKSPAQ
jgi:GTP:adenosylcobinamide-phosphate guanylyltransferase